MDDKNMDDKNKNQGPGTSTSPAVSAPRSRRVAFAINPYQSVIDTLAQFRTKLKDGTLKGIINDRSIIDTFIDYIRNLDKDNTVTLKNCDIEKRNLLTELDNNDHTIKYNYNATKIASLIGLINAFIARLNALSGGKKRRSKRHKKRHKKRNRKTFKRK